MIPLRTTRTFTHLMANIGYRGSNTSSLWTWGSLNMGVHWYEQTLSTTYLQRLFREFLDEFVTYRTVKLVMLKDWRLGLLKRVRNTKSSIKRLHWKHVECLHYSIRKTFFMLFFWFTFVPAPPVTDSSRAKGQWWRVTHALCISISTPFWACPGPSFVLLTPWLKYMDFFCIYMGI